MQAPTQAEVATEFYKLYCEKQIWKPKEKRFDELTEIIRSWYTDLAADRTAIAFGVGCEVQVGQKPVVKFWKSMAAVCKAAGGAKAFLLLCTVTFDVLSGAIGKAKAEALQSEAQTGKRRLVAVAVVCPEVHAIGERDADGVGRCPCGDASATIVLPEAA